MVEVFYLVELLSESQLNLHRNLPIVGPVTWIKGAIREHTL